VRSLCRKVRRLAGSHGPGLRGQAAAREAALEQALAALQEQPDPNALAVVREVALLRLGAAGEVRTLGARRSAGGQEPPPREDRPPNEAVREVWEALGRAAHEAGRSGQGPTQLLVSNLRRAGGPAGGGPYLLVIAYPLPGKAGEDTLVLAATVDFTRLVEN